MIPPTRCSKCLSMCPYVTAACGHYFCSECLPDTLPWPCFRCQQETDAFYINWELLIHLKDLWKQEELRLRKEKVSEMLNDLSPGIAEVQYSVVNMEQTLVSLNDFETVDAAARNVGFAMESVNNAWRLLNDTNRLIANSASAKLFEEVKVEGNMESTA